MASRRAKGKGVAGSSAPPEQGAGENPYPGRARRRSRDQIARDEQEAWEISIKGRKVKAERHILREGFPPNHVTVQAIEDQGMAFWFEPNPGYNLELVEEFYRNMRVPEPGAAFAPDTQITSRVAKLPIRVTPDIIAANLQYVRPTGPTNYPRPATSFDPATVAGMLYENRRQANIPHRPGKFKPAFRFLNQVVCYNLDPRATENKPSESTGYLMTAFMEPDTVCDWALYIYSRIIDFRDAPTQTRLQFPCLISSIARGAGLVGAKWFQNDILSPGPIDYTILAKSIAQTRVPRGGAFLTTEPPANAPTTTWLKKIFCQGAAVIQSQRKIKKEMRQISRTQQYQDHRQEWLVARVEGSTTAPYVPLQLPELEVSDDFADVDAEEEESD